MFSYLGSTEQTCLATQLFCVVIALLSGTTLLAGSDPNAKPPWEWTDEERIAARTNAALRVERLQAAAVPEAAYRAATGRLTPNDDSPLTDVIDGSRDPELFLPTELFESALRLGEGVNTSGLPADFWARLHQVARRYEADLAMQRVLPERNGDAAAICRDRAESLAAARQVFGPALDRFLYETVAPMRSMVFFTKPPNAETLRAEAEGCP